MEWTAMPSQIARPITTVAVTKGELVMNSSTSGNIRDDTWSLGWESCHLEEDRTPGHPYKGET